MSNRTPKEALREIRNRIVYMYGNIDGTFNPPALKEVCEIADDAISSPITEKSSPVGNAAAVRKALEDVLEKIDRWRMDGVMEHWQYSQLFDIADSALSAPPRQCDVGTPEEQAERFRNFCKMDYISEDCPDDCPLYRKDCSTIRCPFAWAQTPYEAKEGGAS